MFRHRWLPGIFALCFVAHPPLVATAAERRIEVFVALCDNESQGIQPVSAKIGDGDVPAANLYWGCSDGLASYFKRSSKWELAKTERDGLEPVLGRLTFKHRAHSCQLVAHAYRGSEIERCMREFFAAIAERRADLVCYVGHNGLMDFRLPVPDVEGDAREVDVVGLCCISLPYFREPLRQLGARPLLLTRQLMYPGSFVIHELAEVWLAGGERAAMRAAAGRAMAKNQKISVPAATGIFAPVSQLDGDGARLHSD